MCFIEDHRSGIGQNAGIGRAVGLLLDREVCKEQMMVDDDNVALRRSPVHFGDETFVP